MHQPMPTIPATPWFSQDYVLEGNANKKFKFGAKETSQTTQNRLSKWFF
jgi:hypothetical protein